MSSETPSCFILTGPATAGITTALDIFSDFGFLQLGGVRPGQVASLLESLMPQQDKLALGLSITPDDIAAWDDLLNELPTLKQRWPQLNVLSLDAPTAVLISRLADSGKLHPYEESVGSVKAALEAQKAETSKVRTLKQTMGTGYYAIDTSAVTPDELRQKIAKILGISVNKTPLTVYLTSFGFKHGIPSDAELLFDMRFVTNPFYVEELRPLTGLDKPVQDYIFSFPQVNTFVEQWTAMLSTILPHYHNEGKLRISIAIGCTGGQHRSVCLTETLSDYLQSHFPEYNVVVTHREQANWPALPAKPPRTTV